MLKLTVSGRETFNEETMSFGKDRPDVTLSLEHSLLSLSKWESIHHKAFLGKKEHTGDEMLDYIRCMNMTQNVDDEVFDRLSTENIIQIRDYISDTMSATYLYTDPNEKGSKETITSELIYYWMFSYHIPKECEKWHLNRLLTLIRVFGIKNNPPKKMSPRQLAARNKALNDQRRKKLNTKG